MRKMLDSLGIYEMDSKLYVPQTPDEMRASRNLELLNRDVEVNGPEDGEDYKTFLDIYSQALDTKAKAKAIAQYSEAYMLFQKPQEEQVMGKSDATTSAMAMNTVNSQMSDNIPSTQNVSI